MSVLLEVVDDGLSGSLTPNNEKWRILNELLDDHFQNNHQMLNDNDEDQKVCFIPTSFESEALMVFLCVFLVGHEHSIVNLTGEENNGRVDDYGELGKLIEAALPVTNAVANIGLEPPGVLEVSHLRMDLEAV